MPIFEYRCKDCGKTFEFLLRGKDIPACPQCGGTDLKKLMSACFSNVRGGSNGGSGGGGGSCGSCSGGACATCGK